MENDKIGKRIVSSPVSKCIINSNRKLIIPNKALTNEELINYVKCLNIPFFRGVFMKDMLPVNIWKNETGIVNLDSTSGTGTHWVCYKKLFDIVYYFDSFGNLPPPQELSKYFKPAKKILYNFNRWQNDDTNVCGHLCLDFLATSVSSLNQTHHSIK